MRARFAEHPNSTIAVVRSLAAAHGLEFADPTGVPFRHHRRPGRRDRIVDWLRFQQPMRRQGMAVYAFRCGRKIKIGCSTHPYLRRRALEATEKVRLTIVGILPGDYAIERMVLERFSKHRLHGEWFRAHADIVAFFETMSELLSVWS